MLENLKQLAMQQLMSKMASNSLGAAETQEAATEGANGIMELLMSQVAGGKIDEIKDILSGGNIENSNFLAQAKAKMSETLQSKGMSAQEAIGEAANTAPDLINSIKDKFLSNDEADSAFDLNALTSLIPGDAGNLLKNVVKI